MIIRSFSRGFTIVELLIVIVVIGILASISTVAFNGIRARAENTKTIAAIDQFSKAIQIYKVNNGLYPLQTATGSQGFMFGCVGGVSSSDKCGQVGTRTPSQNPPGDCYAIGAAEGIPALSTAIQSVTTSVPKVSTQTYDCDNKRVSGSVYAVVGTAFGGYDMSAYVLYYLKGNNQCVTPGGSTLFERNYITDGDITRCYVRFEP